MAAERLSAADLKAIWGLLEALDSQLGPAVARVPSGRLRTTLEHALGGIVVAQWQVARELGGRDGDEPAQPAVDGYLQRY